MASRSSNTYWRWMVIGCATFCFRSIFIAFHGHDVSLIATVRFTDNTSSMTPSHHQDYGQQLPPVSSLPGATTTTTSIDVFHHHQQQQEALSHQPPPVQSSVTQQRHQNHPIDPIPKERPTTDRDTTIERNEQESIDTVSETTIQESPLRARTESPPTGKTTTLHESTTTEKDESTLTNQSTSTANTTLDSSEITPNDGNETKADDNKDKKEKKKKKKKPSVDPEVPPETDIPLPIFVFSLPKSGTTSIWRYFNCGKLWSVHHWTKLELEGEPHERIGVCMGKNVYERNNSVPMLQGCGHAQAWSDAGAIYGKECFYPSVHGLDNIAKFYPNATIVLVTRNTDTWVKSLQKWNGGQLMSQWAKRCSGFPSPSKDLLTDTQQWVDFYNHHTQTIRDFVRDHPTLTYFEAPLEAPDTPLQLEQAFRIPAKCWGNYLPGGGKKTNTTETTSKKEEKEPPSSSQTTVKDNTTLVDVDKKPLGGTNEVVTSRRQ